MALLPPGITLTGTALEIALCIAEGSLLCIGEAVFSLAEQLFGLPDPLTLIVGAFAGRPTMQATMDVASILNRYSSPAIKMLAIGAANSLIHQVPLSSSSGDPYFGPYFKASVDLEQGIRWSRSDANTALVETQTVANALHEAANPSEGQPVTLQAMEQAYKLMLAGQPMGGYSPQAYWTELAQQPQGAFYHILETGWALKFVAKYYPPPKAPTIPQPPNVQPPPVRDQRVTMGPQPAGGCADPCMTNQNGILYQGVEQAASQAGFAYQQVEQLSSGNIIAQGLLDQYHATTLVQSAMVDQITSLATVLTSVQQRMQPTAMTDLIVGALGTIAAALGHTGGSVDVSGIVAELKCICDAIKALNGDYSADSAVARAIIQYQIDTQIVPPQLSQIVLS